MEERIKKDIELFEKNITKVKNKRIKDMATRYYEDAKYYFEQGDLFTSFGCINYAHGLIDSILNRKTKIVEIMGCAGSGKTSILELVIDEMKLDYELAAIIANFVGNEDCKRIEKHGIKTICINTGNKCLNDEMIENAISEIEDEMDYIFVEHIGALTCSFADLMNKKIVIVNPLHKNTISKFPLIFQTADIIVITERDEEIENEIKKLTGAEILYINLESGEGIERLVEWIKK
ncbi:MAG: DUF357 domain-containing protein [Thermoplasmata archaeon]|nr:DUF357 domain-containing protein [Thermoplasmata archaeon]